MEVRNLKAFLANKGMTVKEFANVVDVDFKYMSSIASGSRIPSRRLARDIELATDGVIKYQPRQRKSEKKEEPQ